MNIVKPDRFLVGHDIDLATKKVTVKIEFRGFADPDEMFQRMRDTVESIERLVEESHPGCECDEMESVYCPVHGDGRK